MLCDHIIQNDRHKRKIVELSQCWDSRPRGELAKSTILSVQHNKKRNTNKSQTKTNRTFRAQRFYLKKSKFFRKWVFVFCKFHFLILPTRSDNIVGLYWFLHYRIVFESSLQLFIFKVANLKKLYQFWQKCVDRTSVHVKHDSV